MRNFGENRRAPGCAYLDIPKRQTDYQVRTYPLSASFGVWFLRNPRPSAVRQRSIALEAINTRYFRRIFTRTYVHVKLSFGIYGIVFCWRYIHVDIFRHCGIHGLQLERGY